MAESQTIKVFVSYKRLDLEFVRKLAADLTKNGIEIWVDWEDIPTGEDWRKEIAIGMQDAHALLFVISPEAVVSKEIRFELEMALQNNKRILPIMYRDQEGIWGSVIPEIAKINAVNMRNDEEYAGNLQLMLESLRTDIHYVRQHTKLQQRALEWDAGGRKPSFLLSGEALTSIEGWMVQSVGKEPAPTLLLTEYVHASRQEENQRQQDAIQRQRRYLYSVSIGLAVSVILGIAALFQWRVAENARAEVIKERDRAVVAEQVANDERTKAEANEKRALTAEESAKFQLDRAVEAETSAKFSRDEAVAAQAEAVAARDLAIQQEQLAFARRLGAEGLSALQSSEIERSVLLSISSLDSVSNAQADLALRTGLDLLPRSVALLPGNANNPAVYNQAGTELYTGDREGAIIKWDTGKYRRAAVIQQGSPVVALAYHPSLPWLAAAGEDGSLIIWNTDTQEVVTTFVNTSPVTLMEFNPNGNSLVTAGRDNVVRVWTTTFPTQLFAIPHSKAVSRLAFSRNGSYLVSTGDDGRGYFYEISTRSSRITISDPGEITAMAFHPKNLVMLTGNSRGLVQAWDMQTGREFLRMSHEKAITDVLISPDGSLYLTASEDNTIRVWSTATGQILKTFSHTGPVRDIAMDASGRYLASTSDDETVRIWDTQTSQEIVRSPFNGRAVVFAPNSTNVAVTGLDPKVFIFDYTSAQQAVQQIAVPGIPASITAPFTTTLNLVAVAAGSTISIWDTNSPDLKYRFDAGARVLDVALNNDGSRVLTGDTAGRVCLWVTETGFQEFCTTIGGQVHDVDFSDDNSLVVAGGSVAYVLDGKNLNTLHRIVPVVPEGEQITSVSLDPETMTVALATTADAAVTVYSLEQNQVVFFTAPPPGPGGGETLVEYIHGKNLVLSSQAQTVYVWDTLSGGLVRQFFNTSMVTALAVSTDHTRLAIAGEDFRVYIWDMETGIEIARIPHTSPVVSLAFDASGTRLYTVSTDGQVQANNLVTDLLVQEACRRLTRNLRFSEWMLFLGTGNPYARTCASLPAGDGVLDAMEGMISLAIPQIIAGQPEAADATLSTYSNDEDLRERLLSVLSETISAQLEGNYLTEAFHLAAYLLKQPEVQAGRSFEGDGIAADLCRMEPGANAAQLLPFCTYALALNPDDGSLNDARARLRAQTNDLTGAIKDLQFAIAWKQTNPTSNPAQDARFIEERVDFIAALEKGENPFPIP